MSYSAVNEVSQKSTMVGALVGAAVGAVVGAVVLSAVSSAAPTNLYTAVRPAVSASSISARNFPRNQVGAGPVYAVPRGAPAEQVAVEAVQSGSVYPTAFVCLAAVAGAINGLFLWNNSRQVAAAATTGRREALMAGVAAAGMTAGPAFAAYGEGANIFGKPKDSEQFKEASGEGWSLKLPSKYNVSKEREVSGMVARWEDNFDAVNNSYVVVRSIGKSNVTELGDLDAVRNSIVTPLLGQQAFQGASISEGGFAPNKYSSAAVLDQKEVSQNGKTFYFYELLSRTADGNEGGRHQLFKVGVSSGNLYIYKAQAGDKRWFKGLEKPLRASIDSFTIA